MESGCGHCSTWKFGFENMSELKMPAQPAFFLRQALSDYGSNTGRNIQPSIMRATRMRIDTM